MNKIIDLDKSCVWLSKIRYRRKWSLEYFLLKPEFQPLPTFILEVYCCLNTINGGNGSGHFSLLIAHLRLFDTHMSLADTLLLGISRSSLP